MSDRAQAWRTPFEGYEIPKSWPLDDEQRDELKQYSWMLVLQGEDDPQMYVEQFDYIFEDAEVDEKEAEEFFASVIERRREQQRALGGLPESPLTTAFEELASIGVVARENFTCCGTCGAAEIGDERDDTRQWRGYIFFHQQDAEVIHEEYATYVGYGVFLDAFMTEEEWNALSESQREARYDELTSALMTNEVQPILEKHGIAFVWNGDLGTRIRLENVDFFAEV